MNNIDNGFIQIGGKSIAISSCLPTFLLISNPPFTNPIYTHVITAL